MLGDQFSIVQHTFHFVSIKVSSGRDAPNFNQTRVPLFNTKETTYDKSKHQTYIFFPDNLIIESFNSEISTLLDTLQVFEIDEDSAFLQIFQSWPSAQHSSRPDLVLSRTLTIIPHCSPCKARPSVKFDNSIQKKFLHQCSLRNFLLYNMLYISIL